MDIFAWQARSVFGLSRGRYTRHLRVVRQQVQVGRIVPAGAHRDDLVPMLEGERVHGGDLHKPARADDIFRHTFQTARRFSIARQWNIGRTRVGTRRCDPVKMGITVRLRDLCPVYQPDRMIGAVNAAMVQ